MCHVGEGAEPTSRHIGQFAVPKSRQHKKPNPIAASGLLREVEPGAIVRPPSAAPRADRDGVARLPVGDLDPDGIVKGQREVAPARRNRDIPELLRPDALVAAAVGANAMDNWKRRPWRRACALDVVDVVTGEAWNFRRGDRQLPGWRLPIERGDPQMRAIA